ncbi:MAG: bifunctional phosphopantothenoylcysteine decarboxylase/phosphopantothenate--cysteine ligase CoaBC [Acidimicrobiales bacterium]|nr:bifunctional phosphopantothenoylcysteine decarboxylase/phosphopantothenate--cysteine ligase CoaBC [Acidimicrobiales bacterium]
MQLGGRYVVLGVCGGIAAYKAVELCRRLVDGGARVAPVLTEEATRFVGPLTFSALASEPTRTSLWDGPEPTPHVRLGQACDVVVVAPTTADLLGRYAHGIANDLLSALLLATRSPVVVAPAMHTEMWEHPAVRDNLAVLKRRGTVVVEPAVGRLAGGDHGPGRLAEVDDILAAVAGALGGESPGALSGRTVLVSAGGTREPLDPVRFLGNRSSGKQGYAIAEEAAARGAAVTLVSTVELPVHSSVEVVAVETAAEMRDAMLARSATADAVIMAAAVADFRPKAAQPTKLRRAAGAPEVVLEATPDVLASVRQARRKGQVLVGFAAEVGNLAASAHEKLPRYGVDLLVANDVSAPGAGFGHDTNAVLILGADGSETEVPLSSKRQVAATILDLVTARLPRR